MSNNPYEAPPGDYSTGGMGGGPSSAAMKAKVAPPAIGLMVTGVLNIISSVWGLVSSALFMLGANPMAAGQNEQFEEMVRQGGDQAEFAQMMMQVMQVVQGPVGLIANVITLIIGAVIIFGALKMKNLRSYGLALTATILAMIPCLSNCCIIGLPIGIWALVILLNDQVKQSFR